MFFKPIYLTFVELCTFWKGLHVWGVSSGFVELPYGCNANFGSFQYFRRLKVNSIQNWYFQRRFIHHPVITSEIIVHFMQVFYTVQLNYKNVLFTFTLFYLIVLMFNIPKRNPNTKHFLCSDWHIDVGIILSKSFDQKQSRALAK